MARQRFVSGPTSYSWRLALKRTRPHRRIPAHLIVFGVLLALVILLAQSPPADQQDMARIELTAADVAQVRATERIWIRPPTAVEPQTAFEQYARSAGARSGFHQ